MISLRNEIERTAEFKHTEEIRDLLAREFPVLIRTVADYAVEVDSSLVAEFRLHMQKVAGMAETASTTEAYFAAQSSFRGEVRRYRDLTSEHVAKMRAEMQSAIMAMQRLAEAVASSGTDVGTHMETEIERLEKVAASQDLETILDGIHQATSGLRLCYEEIQAANKMTVAQLQDEIRTLHRDLADERRSLYVDKQSGAWIRQKVDGRMEDLLRQGEAFWILFMKWELKTDVTAYPDATDQTAKALVRRLQGLLGNEALIGRWNQHLFATVIELDPSTEEEMSRDIRAHVSGMYSIQEGGVNIPVCVNIQTAAVTCTQGTKAIDFLPKLGQVTGSLSS